MYIQNKNWKNESWMIIKKRHPFGLNNKIFRMTVTRKTVVGLDGQYMLPDRAHLIRKDSEHEIPPAMKANLNLILNFMCNRVLRPSWVLPASRTTPVVQTMNLM